MADRRSCSMINGFMVAKKTTTGLLFGSFNPIHKGHLEIAAYMLEHEKMDEVWFVVSPQNPLKEKVLLVSREQRLEMTKLALDAKPGFKICDIEFSMPEPSYTIDTLRLLRTVYPQNDFYLMIGSDNLNDLHRWKDHESILNEFQILVYPRGAAESIPFDQHPNVKLTPAPLIEISSTAIRQKIDDGDPYSDLVPAEVYEYILANRLYKK